VPDPATLQLKLTRPDPAFLAKLADPRFSIVDPRTVGAGQEGWWSALGDGTGRGASGMYMVKHLQLAPQGSGSSAVLDLVRNPHFWGAAPHIREIDYTFGGDALGQQAGAYGDYRKGGYDALPQVAAGDMAIAGKDPDLHKGPFPSLQYLVLDPRKPPLDDLRVRQAVALALDKTTLVSSAFPYAQPTGHLVPLGTPGYEPQITGPAGADALRGDTTQARALWLDYVADACHGAAQACPHIVFSPLASSAPTKLYQGTIAMLQAALPGVQAEIGFIGHPILKLDGDGPCYFNTNLCLTGWNADYADPEDWLSAPFAPSGYSITGQVADPRAVALLRQADAEPDAARRIALYHQAEQLLLDHVSVIPVLQVSQAWVVKPYVVNYDPGAWYWVGPQRWAAIYIARH
jgi:ABC-type oligopeptide transport system substrate-binding subunit